MEEIIAKTAAQVKLRIGTKELIIFIN